MSLLPLLLLVLTGPAAAEPRVKGPDLQAVAGAFGPLSAASEAAAPPVGEGKAVPVQQKALVKIYDSERGAALAEAAKRRGRSGTVGGCYGGVADALESAGIIESDGTPDATKSWGAIGVNSGFAADAYQFTRWARAMPDQLERVGLMEVPVPAEPSEVLPGTIVVYQREHCGFSSDSGHIEIAAGSGQACSDHCQALYGQCLGGGSDRVAAFVPFRLAPQD